MTLPYRPGSYDVAFRLSYYAKTSPLIRAILKRLPPERGLIWSERFVDLFLPLHRAVQRSWLAQMHLSRVSPVPTCYRPLPLFEEPQRE